VATKDRADNAIECWNKWILDGFGLLVALMKVFIFARRAAAMEFSLRHLDRGSLCKPFRR